MSLARGTELYSGPKVKQVRKAAIYVVHHFLLKNTLLKALKNLLVVIIVWIIANILQCLVLMSAFTKNE